MSFYSFPAIEQNQREKIMRFRGKDAWRGLVVAGAMAGCITGCSSSSSSSSTPAAETIIVGKILTMDAQNSVKEAVAIDQRGVILAVGTALDIKAKYQGMWTKVETLNPTDVLMPGFIDPHTHLVPYIQSMGETILSPCYPGPYSVGSEATCSNYIKSSLQTLKPSTCSATGGILLGLGLDPSRQPYDPNTSSAAFRKNPGFYIDQDVCSIQPVVVIDQSGHLAYVNKAAFDGLQAWSAQNNLPWPPTLPSGNAWGPSATPNAPDNSKYSGLLIESDSFTPFLEWLGATSTGFVGQMIVNPAKVIQAKSAPVLKGLNNLRDAGITTMTTISDTLSEANGVFAVTALSGSPIRTLISARPPALVAPPLGLGVVPLVPACDPRYDVNCTLPLNLGVTGIKATLDGSTQGCTAAMEDPFLYLLSGPCGTDAYGNNNAQGHTDYQSSAQVAELFAPYWQSGQWRFEIHTNGSRAIKMALDAYAQLQLQRPLKHPVTLVHATVGDPVVFKQIADMRAGKYKLNGVTVPALDVRNTHLIGHVAYWGGAFEGILGVDQAKQIDPIGTLDIPYGIPFTLHSDTIITLPHPLWYVQQAVTRDTWYYPALRDQDKKVLGPENIISVQDALRAITISAAQEKELDGWLGSIEKGKVADFVKLSDNPLNYEPKNGGDPRKIVDNIKVLGTYLNGKATSPLK